MTLCFGSSLVGILNAESPFKHVLSTENSELKTTDLIRVGESGLTESGLNSI